MAQEHPGMTAERFSARLRTATRTDHGDNEHSAYMSALVEGRLNRDEYALLLEQLYFVYAVLEQAADRMRSDEVAGAFDLAGLRRGDALQADLRFFRGPDWAERIRVCEATRRYCERLREVCFEWPGGFVAHHYTRYLGDLSGGQYIGGRLVSSFGLTNGDGVRFYRFETKPKALKERYRALLDTAAWDPTEHARIIDEVKIAYGFNADMATELGDRIRIDPAA